MRQIRIDAKILMKNAGKQIAKGIIDLYDPSASILILIDPGNNGRGSFVIARVLQDRGYRIKVIQVAPSDKIKGDALYYKKIFIKCAGEVIQSNDSDFISDFTTVEADYTFGLGVYKMRAILPGTASFYSMWKLLEIGLPNEVLRICAPKRFVSSMALFKKRMPKRDPLSHKGNIGVV